MKLKKRIAALFIFGIFIVLAVGAGIVLKAIFLNRVTRSIDKSLAYQSIHASFFPPTVVLMDVRSKSASPFFSARRVEISISLRSLLKREKPLRAVIDHPLFRFYNLDLGSGKEKMKWNPALPLSLEYGLIREGEFYYWGNEDKRIQIKGVNALFIQNQGQFTLKAECSDNSCALGANLPEISGRLSLILEGRDEEVRVRKLRLSSENLFINAQGIVRNLSNPSFHMETSYKLSLPMAAAFLELPFEWEGRAEGKGILSRSEGRMKFQGEFASKMPRLNGVPLNRVNGSVDYDETGTARVNLSVQRGSGRLERGRIMVKNDRVWGRAQGLHIDPIMKFVQVPWPVASPVWGDFSIENGKLVADAEFRDNTEKPLGELFPFQGKVHLNWDEFRRELSFSSERLVSNFADVKVEGRMREGQSVDFTIDGKVLNVRQARIFTSKILGKVFLFPEIRGRGDAHIRIFGDYWYPQVKSKLSLSPAGFGLFEAAHLEGEAEIIREDFSGLFQISDPSYKGSVSVVADLKETRAEIRLEKGLIEKILPALEIQLPIAGEGAGRFEYREQNLKPDFKGSFSAAKMTLAGQPITDVRGRLEGTEETFSLPDFRFDYHGGRIAGNLNLGILDRTYACDIQGGGIDLSSFYPKMTGTLSAGLKGKGRLEKDEANGTFKVQNLTVGILQKTNVTGDFRLGFSGNGIDLNANGRFLPGENEFHCALRMPLEKEVLTGQINGFFSNLDLFVPWTGAKGRVEYRADLRLPGPAPVINGVIGLEGTVFPFPWFPHAVRDYAGLVRVKDGELSIRNFKGKLGGGDVTGLGRIKIGADDIDEIDVRVDTTNLELSLLERTRALADGNLHLKKDADRFVLSGDIIFQKLSWRREITEKFAFSTVPYSSTLREPGFFDDLTLNIHLKADKDAWMENSIGKFQGRFDLTVSGNVNAPILLGDIEVLDGEAYFQDRQFKILRGRLSFFNPLIIEPYLNFQAETYIKDYRVTFSLNGLVDNLSPEFASSPPLPPLDVLALLTVGESFRRTYQYERSASQGTASLLSFQLSEEAKKRAENLFNIDRFRIDPFVLGSSAEMTARLTVGKKISRNFFILYSTNLASQREELTRMEWEITKDLSLVATRDEDGRVSIDFKVHKRF